VSELLVALSLMLDDWAFCRYGRILVS